MNFAIVDDGEVTYHNPIGVELSTKLENLLRQSGCFCPSFVRADPYSMKTYVSAFAFEHNETVFAVDRNIYTQVVALTKGMPANPSNRIAAGVMAFASCLSANVAPGIALHEGESSGAKNDWREDLALFHQAIGIHPIIWAHVALGLSPKFTPRLPATKLDAGSASSIDPSRKVTSYEFVYPAALKMATLIQTTGTCDSKMEAFIEWMYNYWHFSAAATALAAQLFSKNPPKGVFKNIGCHNRQQALTGIRNASWDLVYITEWYTRLRKQPNTNELTVICSLDVTLVRTAEILRESSFEAPETSLLKKSGFGEKLQQKYAAYMSDLDNKERALAPMPDDFPNYRQQLVNGLEAELLGNNEV